MYFTSQDILRRIEEFARTITVRSEIIIIGAASIILNVGNSRSTFDIDILARQGMGGYALYDIDIVNEGILFLCPDYRTRLIPITVVGAVEIYSLHPLDVAVVKLGRGISSDLKDIQFLLNSGTIHINDFVNLYRVFRQGYGGSQSLIDDNFYAVTGIRMAPDERMF